VLEREAARLRAEGVDLVVVLAHMGLPLFNEGEDTQNQVEAVAALDDVDVVIGGHTHLRFPGPDHAGIAVADCTKGMVHGKPVVQPGPAGSDLGLIDLRLARTATGRWSVAESDVSLRPVSRKTAEDQAVIAQIAEAHKDTRRYLSRPVGRLKKPINSFFALAHPSPVPALMAAAKRRAIARAAANSPLEKLPLLSVASAPLTGGFDGPDNFLDLAAGPIHLRHLAGMNPYSNNVWAVQTTGAQLVDWLERSALIFNTLEAGNPDQLLINPAVPGFRYDTIYGLSYHIDPREPPLFDMMGRSIHGNQGRIKNVLWQGKPLANDQQFLVATTDHRVGGSGIFKTFDNADIVIQGHAPLQDTLMDYLKNADCAEVRTAQPWTFAPGLDRQAILLTAPEAIHSLADIAHLQPEVCGETDDGFLRVRLRL
jgi:2',3'-cyclic-nucleotide 2'-phosphodiesterase/3'-nucleotidase